MGAKLILLFNHTLTASQEADARASLGVDDIINPPGDIQERWSSIPPSAPEIGPLLAPIGAWLLSQARKGDYVLIQGDFGAVYLMVTFAFSLGIVPIYSTTNREAEETIQPDGSVNTVHRFKHVMFRRYGG